MIYPDYENSIVNLTSSILNAFGVESPYCPVNELSDLKNSKNIILLLVDGLGFEYLQKYGKGSYLEKHCIKKITSVFPSTTAAAVTALETGVPPQQHGITGWFMYLKELGIVSTILPFKPRFGGLSFPNSKIQRSDIFTEKRIGDRINDSSFIIYPDKIVDGKVNKESNSLLTYKTLGGMFSQIKKAVHSSDKRKYIYSYLDNFDGLCHDYGCDSKQSREYFINLDQKISSFIKSLKNSDFTILITADHGLIDTQTSKVIYIQDYPDLYEMLTLPLCGEPRVAYCYVHPDKNIQFENYIKTKLNYCCEIYKSEEFLNKNIFGLFNANKKLKDRIGDYILVMKDNFIIKDFLLTEEKKYNIGNHGGTSKEEMYVPLIQIKSIN
jgi:predicted AlkP superfamily pyrophosphatase or phosphodiesterase